MTTSQAVFQPEGTTGALEARVTSLGAALADTNPLSLDWSEGELDDHPTGLVCRMRLPMLALEPH
jgi:hypothetical protein